MLTVSHDRSEESIEAKARWFRSLSLEDRMDLLCWFTDLAWPSYSRIAGLKDAQQTSRRIRVLAEAQR
jgi:hypothetical protein